MARIPAHAKDFFQLLDAAPVPVYVVDDGRYVRYGNSSFFLWSGTSPNELLGKRCDYHSCLPEDDTPQVAAGLCPPPEAIQGVKCRALVACQRPTGNLVRRWADFIPLSKDPMECPGVMAVLGETDVVDEFVSSNDCSDPPPQKLHEIVRDFHHRMGRQFLLGQLAGDSPTMRRIRQQVRLAAVSQSSVLIVGSPGSGREHIARTIHYAGKAEPTGQLLPIESDLVDAEIFFNTIQAFERQSLQRGEPGTCTILLKEIDQLPEAAQILLNDLVRRPDFSPRVISTSRSRLDDGTSCPDFHDELRFALSTQVLELPLLSQRVADIPILAQVFLEEINSEGGRQLSGFSQQALDHLSLYSWPQNVDELFAVVRQSHRSAEGPLVDVHDLPERIHLARTTMARPPRIEESVHLDSLMDEIEREILGRAMRRSKGNKAAAARYLGISRARLLRRINQFRLEGDGEQVDRSPD